LLGGKKVFNAKYAKDSRRAQRKAPDEHKLHHYPSIISGGAFSGFEYTSAVSSSLWHKSTT
jgi:hypothetical protein